MGTEGAGEPRYWFRAKRYGWGWGMPATWEGWAVLGGYAAVALGPMVLGERGATASLVGVTVATPVVIAVCLRKGEPAAWRWGGRPTS